MTSGRADGLVVAVTGPTGDIGRAFVKALGRAPGVDLIRGMARRSFDPGAHGIRKLEYVRGDVLDRTAVEALVKDADVVVHLAFAIFGGADEAHAVNIEGSRNVFEAALEARVARIVYTSSVAAYGFHDDSPERITEDSVPRGSEEHHYSVHKVGVETLLANLTRGRDVDVYVFRPCIVAGPTALALIERIPYVKLGERMPSPVKRIVGSVPLLRPVIPDPGVPFQLVHEDDVATALVAAVAGRGRPGVYNLAAEGEVALTDLAHALGWYAVPVPEIAVDATARIVSRLPYLPAEAKWVNALRVPVLVDCSRARRELGWHPQHDALDTLAQTIGAARSRGLLPWPGRS